MARRSPLRENDRVDPDIRYVRSGGVAIAYQVLGNADRDLVSGSGIEFESRGTHALKGVGDWALFVVA